MFFAKLLTQVVKTGTIEVIDPSGRQRTIGTGAPHVTLRINDWKTDFLLGLHPTMAVGEAYMDGRMTVEDGTLYDFVDIAAINLDALAAHPLQRIIDGTAALLRRLQQHNPLHRARRNVAHHYDLSDALYDSFLDPQRQYSCAYFAHPKMGLNAAQEAKIRHIAAKLLLKPGQRVLDIGCGWGGLALALARMADVEVLGVTLSVEQHKYASEWVRAAGLEDRVRFELRDYRLLEEQFDRVVSVGMFEHVGVGHYGEFFGKIRSLLKDDGVALLHSIGRHDGPGVTNPWIRRYIFPGGYSPALSEVLPAIERERLWATDIEILRLHYAETLRHWRERFEPRQEEMAKLYDERFCRMWEMYLIGSEIAFRRMGHMVFQIQLAKDIEAVPLTRDYIGTFEKASTPALRRVPDPKDRAKAN